MPFFFVRNVSTWWLGAANAVAGGMMLAASASLLNEGISVKLHGNVESVMNWVRYGRYAESNCLP